MTGRWPVHCGKSCQGFVTVNLPGYMRGFRGYFYMRASGLEIDPVPEKGKEYWHSLFFGGLLKQSRDLNRILNQNLCPACNQLLRVPEPPEGANGMHPGIHCSCHVAP